MNQSNSVKREARIIKRGISYDNILSAVENLLIVAKTIEDSTESILQAIISLSSDTLKDDLSIWVEILAIPPTLISKRLRWILKGGGIRIS